MGPRNAPGPERGLGKERQLDWGGNEAWTKGGDTQLKASSLVGAGDCRGTRKRTMEGKEAGLGRERSLD